VKDIQSYFFSTGQLLPSSLAQVETGIQGIGPDFSGIDTRFSGLVWFHLAPGSSIATQTALIREQMPHAKLIIMSDLPNDMEALAAFSIMAKAYCNTHAGVEVLNNVATVVRQGGIWIGESIMTRLLSQQMPQAQLQEVVKTKWDAILTLREREVAVYIADGLQNRQIAEQMHITERTVKAHVGAILEKLHLKSRLQLALLVKES
jgi:DNA-binding NarL/FixJ family response regulator